MTRIKLTVFALALATCFSAFSQESEEEKKFSFSGSVDTYFRANFNASNDPRVGAVAPGSSFANLPGFSLGMVNLIIELEQVFKVKFDIFEIADLQNIKIIKKTLEKKAVNFD